MSSGFFPVSDLLQHTQLMPPSFSLSSAVANTVFFKITNEISMQLLVSRSLEIQGDAFGAKSQGWMTGWHVMMIIHSWGCTLSSVFLLEKQGCAGLQERRKSKPLKSFWLGGRTYWFIHQPCDVSKCPTWSSCQCLWSPSYLRSKHRGVQRGAEHFSFSSTSPCLLTDSCHEKYFCEQLLALGNRLN